MQIELVRSSHSAGRNLWTLEWCTKYRYKMMGKPENRNIVAACVRQATNRHKIGIIEMFVILRGTRNPPRLGVPEIARGSP